MKKQDKYHILCDTTNKWHVQEKHPSGFMTVWGYEGEYKNGLDACKEWIEKQPD